MTEQKSFAVRFHYIFTNAMAAIYLIGGIILIFVWAPEGLRATNRIIIGIVLIAYSLFRAYRFRKKKE
ncbi:MAG: FeoB-associated Cys-rich membrane protein [Bacteroidia bacterium]|nr:FeoB-associated Cys-rich membrane protein [Bacteroidia bacterium]